MHSIGHFLIVSTALVLAPTAMARTTLSIMTYNTENLFDLKHEPNKDDFTFLPMVEKIRLHADIHCSRVPVPAWKKQCLTLNWDQQTLDEKMNRLATVIRNYRSGRGPDILIFQEVENRQVLEALVNKHLGDQGYNTIAIIDGPDYRGIDSAVVSRLAIANNPMLLPIPQVNFGRKAKSIIRPILKVTLRMTAKLKLTVFAVHFPSPQKSWILRKQSLEFLNKLAAKESIDSLVIAAGDFNNSSEEELHFGLFEKYAKPNWWISHFEGCEHCPGSHFHASSQQWSFLDAILLYRKGNRQWRMRQKSIQVMHNYAFQRSPSGAPQRFSAGTISGVSDHWPVALDLVESKD